MCDLLCRAQLLRGGIRSTNERKPNTMYKILQAKPSRCYYAFIAHGFMIIYLPLFLPAEDLTKEAQYQEAADKSVQLETKVRYFQDM